jgi:hypothetical protein
VFPRFVNIAMAIILSARYQPLFTEVMPDFSHNLRIGHFVGTFDVDDTTTRLFMNNPFFKLKFCLTGA